MPQLEKTPDPEQRLTLMLQAIVDPMRRRILRALKENRSSSIAKSEGLSASDIEVYVRLSQPTVSHHMSVLKKAGLVEVQKLGQWRWYRRNESALRECTRILRKHL